MQISCWNKLSKEIPITLNGALAQLVEQRTFNPFVVGSIPARPTNIQAASRAYTLGAVFNFSLPDYV